MKTILFLTILFFASIANGQLDVSNYKKVSDDFINQRLAAKYFNKFAFTDFYATTTEGSYLHFDETGIEQNTIDSFISITFKYKLFSDRLNCTIPFTITVRKDHIINDYKEINWSIPECVLRDSICDLITADKAVKITFNDTYSSSKYYIEIWRPEHRKDYYWFVSKIIGVISDSDDLNLGTQKIINARNGEAISWKDYQAAK